MPLDPKPIAPARSVAAGDATIPSDVLIAELLRERQRDRKASIIKSALFVLAILVYAVGWYVIAGVNLVSGSSVTNQPHAAVVRIDGMISPDSNASYKNLAPLLRDAFERPNAVGVILNINSPGGTPVQSALIHDLILELKAKHGKPVVAVGEDLMASGAYFIAVSADTIVANRSTVAGSIGVISAGFGFTDLIDRLGVERRVTTAGESKSMLDPFRPVTEAQAAKQRELLEGIHEHFKTAVRDGRGDRLKLDTPGLFEGTVWTGEAAVAAGLIDELGDVRSAAKEHLGVELTQVLARNKPLMERMMDTIGLQVAASLQQAQVSVPLAIHR